MITVGSVSNAGHMNLTKKEVLEAVKENYKKRNKEFIDKFKNELDRFMKQKIKTRKCFAKFQKKDDKLTPQDQICEDQMNVEDFNIFIMVKKRKKDKVLLKKNDELKVR